MFASFPVARAFGITFRIDWTWIAFILMTAIFWPGDPMVALFNWLLIFVIVFLHEVGHSAMARVLSIEVKDITLSFFGGYTRMGWGKRVEDAKAEILVALAGPAVNLFLALLSAPFAAMTLTEGFESLEAGATTSAFDLARNFCLFNLVLGVTNLLPFFPADGGRVFRATLGIFVDWLTATRIAAAVGRIAAVALIVVGFMYSSWVAVLFGFLMWRQCVGEVWMVRARRAQRQRELDAADGFGPGGPAPAKFTPVDPPQPTNESADAATPARRPVDNPLAGAEGPLDDEAIKKLENFRGRLRRSSEQDD